MGLMLVSGISISSWRRDWAGLPTTAEWALDRWSINMLSGGAAPIARVRMARSGRRGAGKLAAETMVARSNEQAPAFFWPIALLRPE